MSKCFRLLPLLALCLVARPLAGQSSVTGMQNLAFGIVIRGVPNSVTPNDAVRRGRFYVKHIINHQIGLRFTLPTQLARVGGGGNLPISFGATDGIAQGTAGSSVPVTFNPHNNQTFNLVTSADFNVYLGGRVSPAANQATGNYTGTITLTCTFF
jgi:hypothetical protein